MAKSAAVSADELDALNNNELRARCVEYGLPNVPITDTSRKLLIRRLRVAMEGGGGATESKTSKTKRRETIQVVAKVNEPESGGSPPKKSRAGSARRTIATVSEPEEEQPTVELTVRKINQRRSSRYTPTSQEVSVTKASTKRKTGDVIIEDVDEDEDSDVQVIGSTQRNIRSSRSPSLGKSKTVTTSYQHVVAPEAIHEEVVHSTRETIIPVQREENHQFTKPPVRIQERGSPSYLSRPSPLLSRPSLGASNSSYTTHSSSSATRRYTTSGLKPQIDYSSPTSFSYKPKAANYANEETSEDNEEAEDEEINAPFLSDFARRLSRLKTEPLASNLIGLDRDGSQYRETERFYTTSIAGRRGINNKESLGESFRRFWIAIDRQYGLRKYLAIIAIALVALFLYIFFVQQN